MGNRAYVTVKTKNESKTFYLHWNGGLDTWCPLSKILFDKNIQDTESVVKFVQSLEIKIEEMNDPCAQEWIEENGHYFLDLFRQTLEQKYESGDNRDVKTRWIAHLQDGFNDYISKYIKKECRESVTEEYWNGIMKAGNEFFKPESTKQIKGN